MLIIAPNTVLNPSALETRTVPKRMLGRIAILPRTGAGVGAWARVLLEMQMLRYTGALTPFVVAMFVWPQYVLPIAQAPLAMILVIGLVETYVLRIPREKRADQIAEDAAQRGLDALRFNGLRVLTRLAATRGIATGEVTLVIEQSEMARVAPLTLVSLQRAAPRPEVLDLDAAERRIVLDDLFTAGFSERVLQSINQRDHVFIRTVTLEAGTISAHARMAAFADTPATVANPA